MNPKYSLITIFMDRTHRLMNKQKIFPVEQQISWKLKDIAYNSLVSDWLDVQLGFNIFSG